MQLAQECNVCKNILFMKDFSLNPKKTNEYYKTCNNCRDDIAYRKKAKDINALIQKEVKRENRKNTVTKGKK